MDPTQAHAFFDIKTLLSYQNVLVMLACWFVIQTLKRLGKDFWAGSVGQKLIVLMPHAVCQVAVWTTVKWQPDATVGERVVLGIVLAMGTANLHDIAKRLGLQGFLSVIGEKQTKLKPAGDPRDS